MILINALFEVWCSVQYVARGYDPFAKPKGRPLVETPREGEAQIAGRGTMRRKS
jgi:hypothetical protein